MKKISIIIILIATVTFTGCTHKSEIDSSNKAINTKASPIKSQLKSHQKYTFAPCARLDYITEKDKKFFQESLDKLGDVPKDNVQIINVGIPTYDDKGNLHLIVFFRNGYDFEIYNLKSHIGIKIDDKNIATSDLEFDAKNFGYLPAKMSRPYELIFTPEEIQQKPIISQSKEIQIISITHFEEKH